MFKLLVLACLLAVAMAAPENVVASKTEHQSTVQNTNDPANPFDDTVVQKKSVQETVQKTDGTAATVAVDKTTVFNPFTGIYNPYFNPYAYSAFYNPYAYNHFYSNPRAFFGPNVPSVAPYTGYSPYSPYNTPYTPYNKGY